MAVVKLQLPAGEARPAPPVGTALGQYGNNLMGFCKEYNERTAGQEGAIIPAEITIYQDRSFVFQIKTPPASDLLKKAAGIEKVLVAGAGAGGVKGRMFQKPYHLARRSLADGGHPRFLFAKRVPVVHRPVPDAPFDGLGCARGGRGGPGRVGLGP